MSLPKWNWQSDDFAVVKAGQWFGNVRRCRDGWLAGIGLGNIATIGSAYCATAADAWADAVAKLDEVIADIRAIAETVPPVSL